MSDPAVAATAQTRGELSALFADLPERARDRLAHLV
jgi:hypothetical protein